MKKVAKIPQKDCRERYLRDKLDLTEQIRADAVNDLENLTEDFQHITLVVESFQHNYKALLAQNRLFKETLVSLVEECYCWQGNRCDRCQKILLVLSGKNPQEKADAIQEYQTLLNQLRKLG